MGQNQLPIGQPIHVRAHMWEMPDKRICFFMGPIAAQAIACAVVPTDHPAERYIEPLLYIACAVLGVSIGVLSIRGALLVIATEPYLG